jgi:hypothetical protein
MQTYVNYYDRKVKLPDENPTIGIVLCNYKVYWSEYLWAVMNAAAIHEAGTTPCNVFLILDVNGRGLLGCAAFSIYFPEFIGKISGGISVAKSVMEFPLLFQEETDILCVKQRGSERAATKSTLKKVGSCVFNAGFLRVGAKRE